ncbi:MAG: hypothetical protein AAGJ40_10905 [Planctomycetota bacterium]
MISFIAWVVFILALVLSVPIVSWLEKRGQSKSMLPDPDWSDPEAYGDEGVDSAPVDDAAIPEDVAEGDEAVEFAEAGGDDFAAFEDEFK